MDSKQMQDLIASKQQEIEMLKNDLAVQELLRGIHFDKLENNVLKDVRMTEYDITDAYTSTLNKIVRITFLLNDKPIDIRTKYDNSKGGLWQVKENIGEAIVKELGFLIK